MIDLITKVGFYFIHYVFFSLLASIIILERLIYFIRLMPKVQKIAILYRDIKVDKNSEIG